MRVSWEEIYQAVEACNACPLRAGCTQTVPGEGDPHAKLMLIGEGPGAEEDRQGRPFVGASGQLLDKMLAAIGLTREQVYIANIVKCRPPHNRVPTPDEAAACLGYLRAQTALIRPKVIVLLGATAARYTVSPDIRITRDRGQWFAKDGISLLVTYHPSALLRSESLLPKARDDFRSLADKARELGVFPQADGQSFS